MIGETNGIFLRYPRGSLPGRASSSAFYGQSEQQSPEILHNVRMPFGLPSTHRVGNRRHGGTMSYTKSSHH